MVTKLIKPINNLNSLFFLKFMIHKLKKMCENLMDMTLTCKNVLALLRYCDNLNLISLKVIKMLKFI